MRQVLTFLLNYLNRKLVFKVEELAHSVIEAKEWDSIKSVIFAFIPVNTQSHGQYDENKESIILGYSIIRKKTKKNTGLILPSLTTNS